MHKIKKGIKKKIKGKKGKHDDDEIFTEEELEQYKREKAEEARRLAEEQQHKQDAEHPFDEIIETDNDFYYESQQIPEEEDSPPSSSGDKKEKDWKSFLATTDNILKKTSDNLEHIKESSYYQVKKPEEREDQCTRLVESVSQRASACASPVHNTPAKGWVDLDKGGIDDEPEYVQEDLRQLSEPKSPVRKKPFVELKPIEDIPDVSAEDYADVFDTAYVDEVESGGLKLIIPDSPLDEYINEPDPFDTSAAEKILQVDEPEPEPEPESRLSSTTKVKQPEIQKKRQIQLVSLGNAVEVLTGKAQPKRKTDPLNEVNLLADFGDDKENKIDDSDFEEKEKNSDDLDKENNEETKDLEPEEIVDNKPSLVDEILFNVDEIDDGHPDVELPILVQPENVHNLDASDAVNYSDEEKNEKRKSIDIYDLVSEFDVINELPISDTDTLIPHSENNIVDEFDAEFASLAQDSVLKTKLETSYEIGIEEDDPFDTSHVIVIESEIPSAANESYLSEKDTEEDPFDVTLCDKLNGQDSNAKSSFSQLPESIDKETLSFEEADPFDTSIAEKVLPVDHLETTENDADLADTLEPDIKPGLSRQDSFDPFDTTAAAAFGVTELKILENELLETKQNSAQLQRSDSDFDFNPRENEEQINNLDHEQTNDAKELACLLTSGEEQNDENVLAPSKRDDNLDDDFDPFDTSIADKIQIKSLEEELLERPPTHIQETKAEDHQLAVNKKPPPRPASPACLLVSSPVNDDINPTLEPVSTENAPLTKVSPEEVEDPFDTSIAAAYGKTELKVLEDELLSESIIARPNLSQQIQEILNKSSVTTNSAEEDSIERTSQEITSPLNAPQPCLLATTPADENPILVPNTTLNDKEENVDFDPFDTSIAQQFGKNELHVLESELLAETDKKNTETDDFDPRANSPLTTLPVTVKATRPAVDQASACLLTKSPEDDIIPKIPIVPTTATVISSEEVEDFDPFDTSIADKLGNAEIKQLENDVLTENNKISEVLCNTSKPLDLPKKPNRPPPPSSDCLLATTPTDTFQPLEPLIASVGSRTEATDNFDPFDTSIANQFGKTEIKALEQTLLASDRTQETINISSSVLSKVITNTHQLKAEEDIDDFDPRADDTQSAAKIDLLDSSDGISLTDCPIETVPLNLTQNELDNAIDPFDTSIATNILPGKFELKQLESELLRD